MNRAEYREKVMAVFIEHLTRQGYPDMTAEQIMGELPSLYGLLKVRGLHPQGMTLPQFIAIAQFEAIKSEMEREMN